MPAGPPPAATLASDAQAIVDRVVQRWSTPDGTPRTATVWIFDPLNTGTTQKFSGNALLRVQASDPATLDTATWIVAFSWKYSLGVGSFQIGSTSTLLQVADSSLSATTVTLGTSASGFHLVLTGIASDLEWLVDLSVDGFLVGP